jgi:hypothetical protein
MPIDYRGHADVVLSGVSMEFAQDQQDYIADRVFPTLPVDLQSSEFPVFPIGWFLRDHVRERPLGEEPIEATYGLDYDTYRVKEYALAATIDDRERANIAPGTAYNPDETHVRFLTDNHLVHKEKVWANRFFRLGVWSVDLDGVTSTTPTSAQITQWDVPTSDPQRVTKNLKKRIRRRVGKSANGLVAGEDVDETLFSHPAIIERTKYTSSDSVDEALIRAYLGLDFYLVPMAMQNVAVELAPQFGDNLNLSPIVNPKGALFLYRNPRVGTKMATGGLTFHWRGLLGGQGFQMPVYRERKRRAWTDWFAVRTAYDMRVVAPDAGIYVDDLVVAG